MAAENPRQFGPFLMNQNVPQGLHYNRAPNSAMRRVAAVDPEAPIKQVPGHRPGTAEHDYWSPEIRINRTKTGRALAKPKKPVPNPNVHTPGTVAFADFHEPAPGHLYIDYVTTRGDQGGKGHARRLVDQIARQYPTHSLDFGRVMHPAIWKMKDDLEARGRKTAGYKDF